MSQEFSIISAGPGHHGLLTTCAREAMIRADCVYASGRVAGALASLRGDWHLCPIEDMVERAMEAEGKHIALVVPGDAGFFGRVKEFTDRLNTRGAVHIYPGISAMQYLCARLGESYDDMLWISGDNDVSAVLSYQQKVCLVLGKERTAGDVCEELHAVGLGQLRVVIGTGLGTGREQILDSTASALRGLDFTMPARLLMFNPHAVDPMRPVFDADLTMASGARIRQEVRWNVVNLLKIEPQDTVYDLGATNGAVSMELARKARQGRVFAVEEQEAARELIARNREALGCYNVRIIQGQGAAAFQTLPAPDAAFIQSGSGNLREILRALKEKNDRVRVVVAADNVERLGGAQMALAALQFKQVTVSQLLLSRARSVGKHTMMLAGDPLFLLAAEK